MEFVVISVPVAFAPPKFHDVKIRVLSWRTSWVAFFIKQKGFEQNGAKWIRRVLTATKVTL